MSKGKSGSGAPICWPLMFGLALVIIVKDDATFIVVLAVLAYGAWNQSKNGSKKS